jgi:hypothetical protein
MSLDLDKLYNLLPAIYRIRDSERGYPLKTLCAVIAEQTAVLEENLEQLYDDQFIETCADWVVPYIGDLLGVRSLDTLERATIGRLIKKNLSTRAQVANTIAYRRRKGTAAVIEELAEDVTGWDARAVEFFERLAVTQHVNHLRPECVHSPNIRFPAAMERMDGPFETQYHTIDVRSITSRRGVYNIPNIGIFIWRLQPYALTGSTAYTVDDRRYTFSPIGKDTQLFNKPRTEVDITHMAKPENMPIPITRYTLSSNLDSFYGENNGIVLTIDGEKIEAEKIAVCNLSDHKDAWAHHPKMEYGIDPVLGRITTPSGRPIPKKVEIGYHYGFSADIGGGTYERSSPPPESENVIEVPAEKRTVRSALNKIKTGSGLVRISGCRRFKEKLKIKIGVNSCVELRAGKSDRPFVLLDGDFTVDASKDSELVLDGLLISGAKLSINGKLRALRLRHCTFVPGGGSRDDGSAQAPSLVSIEVNSKNTDVEIEHSIVGALRIDGSSHVDIRNSIVDATSENEAAYAAPGGSSCGGDVLMRNCTVIGKVHSCVMKEISNSILLSSLSDGDSWKAPVIAERRQEGCVRFTYVPWNSVVPRRYRCQPEFEEDSHRMRPAFTSLQYGDAGYCQLGGRCPREIFQGAEDEAEMGVFHDLYQARRETNLRICLNEYLRFGMEAGILYET